MPSFPLRSLALRGTRANQWRVPEDVSPSGAWDDERVGPAPEIRTFSASAAPFHHSKLHHLHLALTSHKSTSLATTRGCTATDSLFQSH